ncbi:MAG: DUF1549 domain-containing protein, partial [Planctomycetes bacterium]|nr:DUF1549 domain-containing protein [Planctomycetota bacterium]
VPLEIIDATVQPPIEFRNEVLQVLTKSGCNTGKCHGAASGKDGFRLSLFGYDPEGDHFRLTREIGSRRVQLISPEKSLLMLKATGEVHHTGGQCIETETESYELLLQWLSEGAHPDRPDSVVPTGIEVYPKQSVFASPNGQQKLIVLANFSDGSRRDVTARSVFLSNNEAVATVSEEGLVHAHGPGAAFILARFDQFTQGASMVIRPGKPFAYPAEEITHEIDRLVAKRLKFLHISPSPIASDEQFLRRVYIDMIGLLPTVVEYEEFMSDRSADKRSRMIERLVQRPEFKDVWVMKWAELLQIRTSNGVSPKALRLYDQWLREAVHRGDRIDQLVCRILPATGGTLENPATNYYQTETTPQLIAENVAQVFLGTRIQCAQCHNHPFDRWTMDDYYGFASFFSQVGYKQAEDPRELTIYNASEGSIEHPIPGRKVVPHFLGETVPPQVDGRDYRQILAEWLATKENQLFRKNIANLVWAHFLGVGIVEPVDDMRVSNPPSNAELLEYLGDRVSHYQFDIGALVTEICNSRTYQTATSVHESNRLDQREFSHQKIRRLRAEILLDCLSQATDAVEKLPGLPEGSRAVQVADGMAAHYFLNTFGRSNRNSPCTCDTKTSPTLSQALHLLNGETTGGKIKEGNLVGRLTEQGDNPLAIAQHLYRRCYTREMTKDERSEVVEKLAEYDDPREGLEDLFWALLNSNEFVFNH